MKIRLTGLLILVCLIVSSCYNGSEDIKLTFWAMGSEGEKVKPLIEQFEAENPGIRVKVQAVPWGAAYEKLMTAYAGQALPDVCQLGNTWIPQFAMLGALTSLDSLVTASPIIDAENYFDGSWQTSLVNGHIYGLPWYVDTRLLFYRHDILTEVGFEQPPQTWQQWVEMSRRVREHNEEAYANFFSLIFNDWHVPVILILSNGGQLLRENDCYGAFDDPKTFEALRYYVDFFKNEFAPRSMTEFVNVYQGFTEGRLATWITGPWNINQLRERAPELKGKWRTAPVPAGQGAVSTAGGASLVIFKTSKHKAAARRFLEFMSLPETQETFFQLTNGLPAVKSAWNSPSLRNDPEIQAFFKQLESVAATPAIAEWEQIAVAIQVYMEKAIYEQLTFEEAISELNREVDRILERRRWLLQENLLFLEED